MLIHSAQYGAISGHPQRPKNEPILDKMAILARPSRKPKPKPKCFSALALWLRLRLPGRPYRNGLNINHIWIIWPHNGDVESDVESDVAFDVAFDVCLCWPFFLIMGSMTTCGSVAPAPLPLRFRFRFRSASVTSPQVVILPIIGKNGQHRAAGIALLAGRGSRPSSRGSRAEGPANTFYI